MSHKASISGGTLSEELVGYLIKTIGYNSNLSLENWQALYTNNAVDVTWDFTSFRKTGGGFGSARSKAGFQYPVVSCNMILPTLDVAGLSRVIWGVENGSGTVYGINCFEWTLVGGVETFYIWTRDNNSDQRIDITALLPGDAKTALNLYTIKVNEKNVEFFIETSLVGVFVQDPVSTLTSTVFGPPPYGIQAIDAVYYGSHFNTLMETVSPAGVASVLAVSIRNFKVAEGSPRPPRIYNLYEFETNTKFSATTITAGEVSVTSHPFPLLGYENKDLFIKSDQQGTLEIELLTQTDSWEPYYSTGITQDKLNPVPIEAKGALGRVVFTPNTYPCVLSEGELVLQ